MAGQSKTNSRTHAKTNAQKKTKKITTGLWRSYTSSNGGIKSDVLVEILGREREREMIC